MKMNSTLEAQRFYGSTKRHKKLSLSITGSFLLKILLLLLSVCNAKAQSLPAYPSLTFNSPVLVSGTDLQVGAVYNFPNVTVGVDARVTIMGMSGGAWLSEIDNTTGAGYYDAFQPYVGAAANDTSYIDWKFVFKKAGTNIDTILPVLAVTGVDVDGDASALKEFIQAATPGSFALDQGTHLNFSFDGVRSTATSTIDNYALIDTANKGSMFQMNFTNINTILYRNGAITTGGSQVRQTSIYFKSFFNYQVVLPVKLLSFDAKTNNNATDIKWSASSEDGLQFYTVQKSDDGHAWKNIARVNPGMIGNTNAYSITDHEENNNTVYYRLLQMNTNGSATYSKAIRIDITDLLSSRITNSYAANNKIDLQIKTKTNDDYVFDIYTINGVKVTSAKYKIYSGTNQYAINLPAATAKGILLLVVRNKTGRLIYNNKIPVI